MRSFSQIIDAFGGPARYSAATGIPYATAASQKRRDSIAGRYWARVCVAARRHRIAGVTPDTLSRIASEATGIDGVS